MSNEGLLKYAIVEYTTTKNFCNVYDALSIERLEWEVVVYDRQKRAHIDRVTAYIPVTRCKLLVHHVVSGSAQQPGWAVEVFGGSVRDDGIESRLFKVEYDPGDGRFARFPFRLSISSGPGKLTATNGISPDGKPTTQISMRFPAEDFLGICLEIRDYLLIHQRDIEAVRRAAQVERFEQRRSNGAGNRSVAA